MGAYRVFGKFSFVWVYDIDELRILLRQFFFLRQIHGWPDLSMGWRYQIPHLVELGFRVVAPDMMGYGGTVRICPRQLAAIKGGC